MKTEDYDESGIKILAKYSNHFWFEYRNRIIYDMLLKHCRKNKTDIHILELGAGSGNICTFLKSKGYKIDASDIYESASEYCIKSVDAYFTFDLISEKVPNELMNKYDVLILGDVLEHLNNPNIILEKIKGFIKQHGFIIVTVPALMKLWSAYDILSHHKKRYSIDTMKKEIINANYKILDIKYIFFIPAIILYIRRKCISIFKTDKAYWLKELDLNPIVNKIINVIMRYEYYINRFIKYPFGSSLICISEKT